MKKLTMILCALVCAAVLCALPFLCIHANILPEVSTAYYEYKAKEEALTATGPEAELMRMLTGLTADTKLEPVSTPITFSWYGMALAIGAAAGLGMLLICARQREALRSALLWSSTLALPFALIGARLVYCAVNIAFYLQDIAAPMAMLKVWEGGLSLSGALVFIVLAGILGAKAGKAPVGEVLHALVPAMYILAMASAAASRIIHMGYGPEMAEGFLSIDINGTPRLDTAWLVIILVGLSELAAALRMQKTCVPAGSRFALYAFLYGTVMILLESLRKDGHMVWGFVHAEMLFDLFFALGGMLYLAKTKKRILLSLLATAVLAGAVVALEFALDRSSIGDGLLYGVYVLLLALYGALGCSFLRKAHN